MNELLRNNFVIQIISVSSMGLDSNLLGITLNHSTLQELIKLSMKYGFNISFEGGEAETIVLDCPIFRKRLEILDSKNTLGWSKRYSRNIEYNIIRQVNVR